MARGRGRAWLFIIPHAYVVLKGWVVVVASRGLDRCAVAHEVNTGKAAAQVAGSSGAVYQCRHCICPFILIHSSSIDVPWVVAMLIRQLVA